MSAAGAAERRAVARDDDPGRAASITSSVVEGVEVVRNRRCAERSPRRRAPIAHRLTAGRRASARTAPPPARRGRARRGSASRGGPGAMPRPGTSGLVGAEAPTALAGAVEAQRRLSQRCTAPQRGPRHPGGDRGPGCLQRPGAAAVVAVQVGGAMVARACGPAPRAPGAPSARRLTWPVSTIAGCSPRHSRLLEESQGRSQHDQIVGKRRRFSGWNGHSKQSYRITAHPPEWGLGPIGSPKGPCNPRGCISYRVPMQFIQRSSPPAFAVA